MVVQQLQDIRLPDDGYQSSPAINIAFESLIRQPAQWVLNQARKALRRRENRLF